MTEYEKPRILSVTAQHVAELERENAKLRNQLEEQKCFAADLEKDVRALRELVRDMARAWWACDNERCPHGSSCDAAVSEGKLTDCEMERRMREFGIEVDE